MMKPSRARAMAGANKSAQGSAPCAAWASAARRMLEGTPTLRPDSTASIKGNGRPSWPRNQSGAAAAGAVSRPSRVSIVPSAEWCSRNPPPPIPELCGSTTVSASIVAIAASVALPPRRSISAPASAARGSAALTTPRASAVSGAVAGAAVCAVAVVQAPNSRAAETIRVRGNIGRVLFASHRLGNRAEPVAPHQSLEPAHDPAGDPGPLVDHRAVQLDEARPGPNPLPRVLGGGDPADADQRQPPAGRLAEVAQALERERLERRAGEPARLVRVAR